MVGDLIITGEQGVDRWNAADDVQNSQVATYIAQEDVSRCPKDGVAIVA